MGSSLYKWVSVGFFNLLLAATLGCILRYKILYSLPLIDQSFLLHAHSHFAFSGWVTHILMVLMWGYLYKYLPAHLLGKYKWLVIANLVAAYGMLLSFPWEGYGIVSIIFSSLSIVVSYVFAINFWKDLDKIKVKIISKYWFKAALIFSVLSSFGVYSLSYIMANNIQHPDWFLASTYYFLHFQYNGWFFFACMGLLNEHIKSAVSFSVQKQIFWLFALACVPAYFLSALWLPIPTWIYIVVVMAAAAELLGWIFLLRSIILKKKELLKHISIQTKWLFILSAVALSIKLLLQLGSVIPALSKLAFGFRPVVIGYLHLMFLGVITLFILGFCKMSEFIVTSKKGNTGITIFIAGIILNEMLLMIQGLSYMNYITILYINEMLLAVAVVMFFGLLLLNTGIRKTSNSLPDN
ncbi:MAG: hypothetical protein ABI691_12795 [Ginsengibacter sp.]